MYNFNTLSVAAIMLMGLGLFTACTKEHEHDDANHATITLTSPTEAQVLHHGDTLKINGTIIAEQEMHGYTLALRNKQSNANIFVVNAHDHGATYQVHQTWVDTLATHTDLVLEVVAILDHEGNTANKLVNLVSHP